mgnify:CR=1 FL=1
MSSRRCWASSDKVAVGRAQSLPVDDSAQHIDEPVLKNLYEHCRDELPRKGQRTQLALDVAWDYDAAGCVGGIRVTPGRNSAAGGRSLQVDCTIAEIDGSPSASALLATIRYLFTHASEREQVAITTIIAMRHRRKATTKLLRLALPSI